jgi:Holliday junction resolvasome RuvABC DNA-binding subunit
LPRRAAPALDGAFEEAVAGLIALGYREPDARAAAEAARAARGGDGSPQDIIRDALGRMAGRP